MLQFSYVGLRDSFILEFNNLIANKKRFKVLNSILV